MVHALEQIHYLVSPAGVLIDIHPFPEGAVVTALQGGRVLFSEREREADEEDVLAADWALGEVLRRGSYIRDRAEEFEFGTHAASVLELRKFWEEVNAFDDEPREAAQLAREERIYGRIEAIMQFADAGATVAMLERCRIARLRPVRTSPAKA